METVFSYTRQDAINDGVFVDVSEMAKEAGIKYRTAITRNLFETYIVPQDDDSGQSIEGRQWDVLSMFFSCAKGIIGEMDGNMGVFPVIFTMNGKQKTVEIWGFIEATSPDNTTPAINIMLPEDY